MKLTVPPAVPPIWLRVMPSAGLKPSLPMMSMTVGPELAMSAVSLAAVAGAAVVVVVGATVVVVVGAIVVVVGAAVVVVGPAVVVVGAAVVVGLAATLSVTVAWAHTELKHTS